MDIKYVTKTLIHPGDKIETLLESVTNRSLTSANDVQIVVEPPPGVSFVSGNLGQGTYGDLNNIWSIGTLTKGQSVSGNLIWNVLDDCLAPFKFTFQVQAVGGNVCIDSTEDYCVIVNGVTKCQLDTFKPIKTVSLDYTLELKDYTILVDAGGSLDVNITLPNPADAYRTFPENSNMDGGKEWHIKVIDLTNAVTLTTPSGKIVDMSNITDATDTFTFSVVGQTAFIHSDGTNYYVKKV